MTCVKSDIHNLLLIKGLWYLVFSSQTEKCLIIILGDVVVHLTKYSKILSLLNFITIILSMSHV
jgi:hypothetical protein